MTNSSKRNAQRRHQRALARSRITGDESWHGTTSGYSNHCCRCELCRTAYRAYVNEWRRRPDVAERRRALARIASKAPHRQLAVRARTYGLDREHLSQLLSRETCDACGATEPGVRPWAVDHDHSCCPGKTSCGRCVRGILCHACNLTLGAANDDLARLAALAAYVTRTSRAPQ